MKSSSSKKIRALLNLTFQFIVHCLKKIFIWKRSGLKDFENNYRADGLLPLQLKDQEKLFSFSACLNCRLCDATCPALFKMSRERFPGPSYLLTTYSRSFSDLWATRLDLTLCQDCNECVKMCPNQIDVKGAVKFIQTKIAEQIQFTTGVSGL